MVTLMEVKSDLVRIGQLQPTPTPLSIDSVSEVSQGRINQNLSSQVDLSGRVTKKRQSCFSDLLDLLFNDLNLIPVSLEKRQSKLEALESNERDLTLGECIDQLLFSGNIEEALTIYKSKQVGEKEEFCSEIKLGDYAFEKGDYLEAFEHYAQNVVAPFMTRKLIDRLAEIAFILVPNGPLEDDFFKLDIKNEYFHEVCNNYINLLVRQAVLDALDANPSIKKKCDELFNQKMKSLKKTLSNKEFIELNNIYKNKDFQKAEDLFLKTNSFNVRIVCTLCLINDGLIFYWLDSIKMNESIKYKQFLETVFVPLLEKLHTYSDMIAQVVSQSKAIAYYHLGRIKESYATFEEVPDSLKYSYECYFHCLYDRYQDNKLVLDQLYGHDDFTKQYYALWIKFIISTVSHSSVHIHSIQECLDRCLEDVYCTDKEEIQLYLSYLFFKQNEKEKALQTFNRIRTLPSPFHEIFFRQAFLHLLMGVEISGNDLEKNEENFWRAKS